MDNKINNSAALWNTANEKLTEKIHSQDIDHLIRELKRVHMKSDELYVYCSDSDKALIERSASRLSVHVAFQCDGHVPN